MRKVLGLVGATLLFAGPALAADLSRPPVYKAPPMAPAFSWTGCYIGATAGGAWGKSDVSWDANPAGFAFPGAIDTQTAGSITSGGFTGGGEVGCNYQFNPWLVVGVEGDFEYTGLSGSNSGAEVAGGFVNPFTESFSSKWLSTVRGRVGIANGQFLVFVTGGAAFANPTFSDSISFAASGSTNAASSSGGTITGWVAGGGVEWFFMPQWSLKAEYLHVDFGTTTFTSVNPLSALATIDHSHTLTEDIGRLGLNFHF